MTICPAPEQAKPIQKLSRTDILTSSPGAISQSHDVKSMYTPTTGQSGCRAGKWPHHRTWHCLKTDNGLQAAILKPHEERSKEVMKMRPQAAGTLSGLGPQTAPAGAGAWL